MSPFHYRNGFSQSVRLTTLDALGAVLLQLAPAAAQDEAPAAAQEPAQEESFTPEHLNKAEQVIELTKSAEGFDNILPIIADQTMTLFIRTNPALTREIEEVTTEAAIEMAQRRVQLNEILHKIWARRFSPEELDEIIAFFESDTGQKFAELTPSIAALSVGASKQWSDAIATDMVTKVRAELQERGHQL